MLLKRPKIVIHEILSFWATKSRAGMILFAHPEPALLRMECSLLEIQKLLFKAQVDANEEAGEQDLVARLIGEAHRTQSSELGENIFEAFPNAARIAFTELPSATEKSAPSSALAITLINKSCGRNGTLNFHWKCTMAPPQIIDYITVHELCHFHYRNHSDAFWNEVDKVIPDWRERKEWLRKRGASLDS